MRDVHLPMPLGKSGINYNLFQINNLVNEVMRVGIAD